MAKTSRSESTARLSMLPMLVLMLIGYHLRQLTYFQAIFFGLNVPKWKIRSQQVVADVVGNRRSNRTRNPVKILDPIVHSFNNTFANSTAKAKHKMLMGMAISDKTPEWAKTVLEYAEYWNHDVATWGEYEDMYLSMLQYGLNHSHQYDLLLILIDDNGFLNDVRIDVTTKLRRNRMLLVHRDGTFMLWNLRHSYTCAALLAWSGETSLAHLWRPGFTWKRNGP